MGCEWVSHDRCIESSPESSTCPPSPRPLSTPVPRELLQPETWTCPRILEIGDFPEDSQHLCFPVPWGLNMHPKLEPGQKATPGFSPKHLRPQTSDLCTYLTEAGSVNTRMLSLCVWQWQSWVFWAHSRCAINVAGPVPHTRGPSHHSFCGLEGSAGDPQAPPRCEPLRGGLLSDRK